MGYVLTVAGCVLLKLNFDTNIGKTILWLAIIVILAVIAGMVYWLVESAVDFITGLVKYKTFDKGDFAEILISLWFFILFVCYLFIAIGHL